MWGNYNHKIHSKDQSKQIKYRNSAVIIPTERVFDDFDRMNQQLYILNRKWKDIDLDDMKDSYGVDNDVLGFIHDHNACIPAWNMYHEGQLENMRRIARITLHIKKGVVGLDEAVTFRD